MTGPANETAEGEAGFSLTEVLVSVFIFAIIGSISVGLMSASLTAQEQNAEVLDQSATLDMARTLLREDLGQIVLRPVRDDDGRTNPQVFAGNADGLRGLPGDRIGPTEEVVLGFTRRGRANPGLLRPRSSLARIEYVLRDGNLVRRVLAAPDGGDRVDAAERVLVADVQDVELDFLVGASWTRQVSLRPGQRDVALPRAVRLRYSAPRLGAMEHIILTAEAGG